MIVVSDTSPLNYLILIEAVGVLPALYREVYVPQQVIDELDHPGAPAAVRRWVEHLPAWACIREPSQIDPRLAANRKLDAGEIHAIALAQELGAKVLIDERNAYEAAKACGLTATGTLGILDAAAERDLLNLRDALGRLVSQTNFRHTQSLLDRLIERDVKRRR